MKVEESQRVQELEAQQNRLMEDIDGLNNRINEKDAELNKYK